MATDTRQKLIEAAKKRFYRDGFRNVGIDQVLDDVGISKSTFYNHFESKDELMVAVLDDIDDFIQQVFRQMVKARGGPTGAGQLRAILDVVQQVIERDDFHGCIFVNAAMEFPLPHEPAHQAALRHKRAIEEFVHELAERSGVLRPMELAEELCLIIEGAYVTRTVTSDPTTLAIARRLADQVIDRHMSMSRSPAHGLALGRSILHHEATAATADIRINPDRST